eukprot:6113277-Pyramimonas_sp.AAC.1
MMMMMMMMPPFFSSSSASCLPSHCPSLSPASLRAPEMGGRRTVGPLTGGTPSTLALLGAS